MIIAAAIRHDGYVYALPAPARHHDIIAHIAAIPGTSSPVHGGEAQGFIDHEHGFITREAAAVLAVKYGQVENRETLHQSGTLFSEDLW